MTIDWKSTGSKVREWLNKNLFQIEETNERKAWAVAWGVFMAIFPLWGLQTLIALGGAQLLRLNKIIVLCASGISVFPVMPFVMYAGLLTGGLFVSDPQYLTFSMEITKDDILPALTQYLIGSSVLAVVSGAMLGILSYWVLEFRKKS